MQQQTKVPNGQAAEAEDLDLLEARYGSRFLREEAPPRSSRTSGCPPSTPCDWSAKSS